MTLFENTPYTGRSGISLAFKVECDALSDADIAALAAIIQRTHTFREVHGVPRGGLRLADELKGACSSHGPILIVEDVLTTGASMERFREQLGNPLDAVGVVIFARGECPAWVKPIWMLSEWARP